MNTPSRTHLTDQQIRDTVARMQFGDPTTLPSGKPRRDPESAGNPARLIAKAIAGHPLAVLAVTRAFDLQQQQDAAQS